ncbi:MAG TPA: LysM peptidoglycan-binding domain-containing protein [Anaerolineae bacterium]|nr:LysM peptidoglycan-binding domain-containing protein [Anaerolineae bacterium]
MTNPTSDDPFVSAIQNSWLRVQARVANFSWSSISGLRLASHIGLVIVIIGVLALTQVKPPEWQAVTASALIPDIQPSPTPDQQEVVVRVVASGGSSVKSSGPLTRAAVPFTIIPDRPRTDIITYEVQPGDTVFGIAEKFGIKPETIMWSNPVLEQNPDLLRIGDKLVILPVDGVYHKIKEGDTIAKIAKKYKVKPETIINFEWNNLDGPDATLTPGEYLIVPGGTKPYVARTVKIYRGPIPKNAKRGTGNFVWPVSGYITQGFWNNHRAIDIGSWLGNPVVASDSGYVVYASWDRTGYGNLIIIDHGNGYRTYYAHLSAIYVRVGDSVAQGQQIGAVGSTGRSTGPHLHFEIRYRNVQRNPLGFLR